MWRHILNEAVALHKQGDLARAEQLYLNVLAMVPEHGDALHLLGMLYAARDDRENAYRCLKQAVSAFPDMVLFLFDFGAFNYNVNNLDEAEKYLRQTIALKPDHIQAYFFLGNAYRKQRKYELAAQSYIHALHVDEKFVPALCNLGTVYGELNRFADAISCLEKALTLSPNLIEAYNNLGLMHAKTGDIEKALICYRTAYEKKPQEPLIYSNILMYSHYLAAITRDEMFALHTRFQELFPASEPRTSRVIVRNKRIRIGYVSADFRMHSAGYFIEPVLAVHNKYKFDIFCYSDTALHDETTRRMKEAATFWRDSASMSDDALFNAIQTDGIDILVDLAGHTEKNRMSLFARRAAPVQVTWLGYPDTTGLAAMDYRLSDTHADPEGSERFHTEEIIRLPECFLCYRPPDMIPRVLEPPFLTNGYITFGSFNNLPKINDAVIDVWSLILRAAPTAKLYLKSGPFSDAATQKKFFAKFEARGITNNRLILNGQCTTVEGHLDEYNRVDIALDPFPYNGTTTTFESLLMGTPVITLAGTCHAGRVGVSILTNLNLTEMIAETTDRYAGIAARYDTDRDSLLSLRSALRQRLTGSVLCDAEGFTKKIEYWYSYFVNKYLFNKIVFTGSRPVAE